MALYLKIHFVRCINVICTMSYLYQKVHNYLLCSSAILVPLAQLTMQIKSTYKQILSNYFIISFTNIAFRFTLTIAIFQTFTNGHASRLPSGSTLHMLSALYIFLRSHLQFPYYLALTTCPSSSAIKMLCWIEINPIYVCMSFTFKIQRTQLIVTVNNYSGTNCGELQQITASHHYFLQTITIFIALPMVSQLPVARICQESLPLLS